MKKLYVLLVIAFIFVSLYSTNPTKTDFKEYAEERLKTELKNEGIESNSFMESLLNIISGEVVSTAVDIAVKRDDYLIFSVYSIESLDLDYKFLGIFRQFIPIKNFIDVEKLNISFKDPRAIIDEKVDIEEDHYRTHTITLNGPTEITISTEIISGPKIDAIFLDTKGMNSWKKLTQGSMNTKYSYYPSLSQSGQINSTKTETFDKGTYYLILDNTDIGDTIPPMNLQNDTCTVKVKVLLKELY